jgi:membrane-associated phospholipid phosphatase
VRAALLLVPLLGAACASTPTRTHFRAAPIPEIAGTVGMVAVTALIDLEKHDWDEMTACFGDARAPTEKERVAFLALPEDGDVCDETKIIPPDRWVSKMNWPPARQISDIGVMSMLALPFAFSALDTLGNDESAERIGVDAIVASESIAATLLAGAIVKMAARRPRPLTYNKTFGKRARFGGDARLSFPSNHSSAAFAGASVTSVMVLERYGVSTGSVLAVSGAYLGAATVGTMRMLAGKHFLTDVLVGAALGTFFGLMVPIVHLDRAPKQILRDTAVSYPGPDRVYVPVVSFGGGW